MHRGGPALVRAEHPDRPVPGALIALSAQAAGQTTTLYVVMTVAAWLLLGAVAAMLWRALFPEWPEAAPLVALAMVSPLVVRIQFTTVTTLFPVVVPVLLALAALVLVLRRPERGISLGTGSLAAVLFAAAVLTSEYGLATTVSAFVLLLLLRRPRSAMLLAGGAAAGYLGFRLLGDVAVRKATDPDLQLFRLVSDPWPPLFRIASSAWYCTVGAWADAASGLTLNLSSKSTLAAFFAGLAAAALATVPFPFRGGRSGSLEPPAGLRRRLLALPAAVLVGLTPAVIITGWPPLKVYESRFALPIMAFGVCFTVAVVLSVARVERRALVAFFLAFLAAHQLVRMAFEERSLALELDRFGERIRPLLANGNDLTIIVVPDRPSLMSVELLKAARTWTPEESGRLWFEEPQDAYRVLGPRSSCRDPRTLRLEPPGLRWPMGDGRVSQVLWAASKPGSPEAEPYFRCDGR
jgi:hypothetical protein